MEDTPRPRANDPSTTDGAGRPREQGQQSDKCVGTRVDHAIRFDDLHIRDGFRADLIVEGKLLIELKSVERLTPVHSKLVLTYLRFLDLRIGLLMNFGGPTFREGLKRIVNKHGDTSSSPLRVKLLWQ